ncbi:hypothetical protein B0H17DRAFT_489140 [Mycena rosella]|uniref:GYF domain-containing protein n=1 Tax=Mycena rosella TaxID=1033263 RepID=A0AAD7DLJ3_MYCRO|nr:hypothetical protein B0H17DRAFT_489140 [Mycena rosella]
MSTTHSSSMQFGPEWMRAKPVKPHGPSPPPPPTTAPAAGASSYSALVSPAPPPPTEKRDETHPFRYSRDEMLKIYRDGGGKGGLGLEVERWEGIVREVGSEPVGLREMGENEKKLFAGSLNSELRRRQSIDYLSPLSTQGTTGDRPRLPHSNSASGTGSPLRERFGGLMRRRDSTDQLTPSIPRKLSLSSVQAPLSPRDAALPSPRTRLGHTPTFDGVLNGGESWVARRRASEAKSIGNASRDPDHHEGRGLEIREEDEDATLNSNPHETPQATASPSHDPPPAQPKAGDGPSYVQNGSELPATTVPNGPPPGILDLASVQWSYLDPQGQLQGPFRADLMQKWYDDGYFTADLLMKRTHLDVEWVAVGTLSEFARSSGSEKLFLSPPRPSGPPAVSRPPDHPGQAFVAPGEQNTYNAPLQPAPVRSLRSSTLEAYVGGSSHSASPSSSFGAGRFGSGSPDSNGFGGRANQYSTDPAVGGGRFGVAPESSSSLRRNAFAEPSTEQSALGSRFTGGGVGDVYTANGSYSPSQGPWQGPSSNALGGTFDAVNGHFGSSSNLAQGLGQGSGFGHIRPPQDSPFGDVPPANFPDFIGSPQIGGASFGPGPQYSAHLHSSPYIPPQAPAVSNMFGQPSKPVLPQPVAQNSGIPAVPTQSPWGAVPRTASFDGVRPVAHGTTNRPTTPLQASPWGAAVQPSEPSPWYAASHGIIDESNWKEERGGHSLTFSNLGQHNQQFTSVPDDVSKAPVTAIEGARPSEIPDTKAPTKPAAVPPQPTKTRTKSTSQTTAQPPIAPSIPAAESSPQVPAKAAWTKEEEAKKPKPSGVTLSLRDIQDAEAKKVEARKVAERDRDRAVRASSSTAPAPEEAQPFTASWGLPTSQAGARAAPAKETGAAASPTTGAVWTNATKPVATKKTMKEIQEEEEKRKKTATKETTAAAARRAYAESTSKAPPPPVQGAAWTTVGATKPSNPAPAPVRPPIVPAATSTSTSVPRANGAVAPRAAPAVPKAPAPRVEEYPATASHEFVRWLNDSLKGLNSSVNVEEIMSMLLSFPVDPDLSTVELISDLIYANSTTLDGRRFAAEFVSKRKADAASRPKGAAVAGAAAGKPVSIADVVKAQPKAPASSEWGGFKV